MESGGEVACGFIEGQATHGYPEIEDVAVGCAGRMEALESTFAQVHRERSRVCSPTIVEGTGPAALRVYIDAQEVLKYLTKLLGDNGVPIGPISMNNFAAGVIIHELAHQLDKTSGHYKDSNGDGQDNQPDDFQTVQFKYDQAPLPAGYYYQDYYTAVGAGFNREFKFGHAWQENSFVTNMALAASGAVPNPFLDP
jgi:hypothetical protein